MQCRNLKLLCLSRISSLILLATMLGFVVPVILATGVYAQTATDTTVLAKEIDKNLRAAERDMFSGKNESADQQLDVIAVQIEELEAADPDHPKLKSLESKYAKIRKDVDRKLGVTASAAPAAAVTTPSSGQSDLPRAIQSDMSNATTKLDEAESAWSADSSGGTTVSGSSDPREVKLEAVEQPLKSANYYYGSILKKCESKSSPCDPGHPDIAAIKTRIDAIEADVAGLEAELAEAAAASAATAAEQAAQAQAAEEECEAWNARMKVYTEGDKALYRCVSAEDEDMPACKESYDEAVALMAEFDQTPWAAEPCGGMHSTVSDLNRYMENFSSSYESYAEEKAAAAANMGDFVFSKQPIDPANPSGLTTEFQAGDTIYGLIRTKKSWSEIYGGKSTADVMVSVKLDGNKIHAQLVTLKSPDLLAQQFLVFDVAPDPANMTAYGDPNREYGKSTATLRQGPNELTHHLGQLGPGEHTMAFDITYFGTTWAAGEFTITGDDFQSYAALHAQIAEGVAQAVTLPAAQMTNKSLAAEMEALLENAGWEDIHRINIVDKDWWTDRDSGGDSAVKSRHVAAAALAKDGQGYYYKVCTFHQDKLITGGFGDLYLSHQGDRVPVPEANIDK